MWRGLGARGVRPDMVAPDPVPEPPAREVRAVARVPILEKDSTVQQLVLVEQVVLLVGLPPIL